MPATAWRLGGGNIVKFDQDECLRWCFGELLSNAARGKVAEFVVAKALGIAEGFRQEWDACDLRYGEIGIEVKSSAYLQSWYQKKPSAISFDIAPRKQTWEDSSNTWSTLEPPRRVADIYVFCIFKEQDRTIADPLITDQWEFFILSTSKIDKVWGMQKTLSHGPLQRVATAIQFEDIRGAIDDLGNLLP
jgi:hypothetical protein